ncbi:unnamed protein product, partial [Mesorhabditis belari]|uniref:Uncharacterized protein n=1 Tax=Mesorhabditis belari TaxID=2138241 RepID=A0AAF3J4I2_9BILA
MLRVLLCLSIQFLPILSIFGIETLGTLQSAGVQGNLTCNGAPYSHARIKMWEVDIGPIPDDLWMETFSDSQGFFKVQGNESETGWIDPKISIFHDCNDETVECLRKLTIVVPREYITQNSATPEKYFDIGTINLGAKFTTSDDHDCSN